MLAVRLHPDRRLRLEQAETPVPAPGEALVKVTAVGLCGSDRHWLVDGGIGDAILDEPLVLGREFAGVATSGRLRGRRVAVDPAINCGRCEPCRTGAENLCLDMRFAGHGRVDGALREQLAWPERLLHPLADSVTDVEGALVEPLSVAIHGMDLGGLQPGATAAVIGCGPIGLLTVALCRLAGARTIVATDPHQQRRDAAIGMGADNAVETAEDPVADGAALLGLTAGRGYDVAFDAAGDQAAVDTAVAAARPGGRIVLLGIPSEDRTASRPRSRAGRG
jgi:L-iditol 2-dehydrogenase